MNYYCAECYFGVAEFLGVLTMWQICSGLSKRSDVLTSIPIWNYWIMYKERCISFCSDNNILQKYDDGAVYEKYQFRVGFDLDSRTEWVVNFGVVIITLCYQFDANTPLKS